jgi:hypothetical protein
LHHLHIEVFLFLLDLVLLLADQDVLLFSLELVLLCDVELDVFVQQFLGAGVGALVVDNLREGAQSNVRARSGLK